MLALVVGVDCALLLPECAVSLVWLLLTASDPSGLGLRCGDLVSKCGWGRGLNRNWSVYSQLWDQCNPVAFLRQLGNCLGAICRSLQCALDNVAMVVNCERR